MIPKDPQRALMILNESTFVSSISCIKHLPTNPVSLLMHLFLRLHIEEIHLTALYSSFLQVEKTAMAMTPHLHLLHRTRWIAARFLRSFRLCWTRYVTGRQNGQQKDKGTLLDSYLGGWSWCKKNPQKSRL